MTEYRVIHGFSGVRSDEEAAIVGGLLEKRFKEGPIDPAAVVRLAKPARSPLHRYFTWDDARAAQEHRLTEARGLLRSIAVVHHTTDEGEEWRTRAYHSVALKTDSKRSQRFYLHERLVWTSPELADQVVARAYGELVGWQARYRNYQELRAAGELVASAAQTLADRT